MLGNCATLQEMRRPGDQRPRRTRRRQLGRGPLVVTNQTRARALPVSTPIARALRSTVLLAFVATPAGQHAALAIPPARISEIRLEGDLLDSVSGLSVAFDRPSEARSLDGLVVPSGAPRFEPCAVASGFDDWQIGTDASEFVPLAVAWGQLFASDLESRLFVSDDGEHFVSRGLLPGEVIARSSAYVTPGGALLVGLKHTGQNPLHKLWRSDNEGYSFSPVLEFPLGGWPAHWNFTSLHGSMYVSTYGTKQGASQYVYKSEDDGRTWQLVYDPGPIEGFHFHKIIADPQSGLAYAAYGDGSLLGTLISSNGGTRWSAWNDFNLPTSALARPDAIYWGSDGWGRNHVARYHRETDTWSYPLRPWLGYTQDSANGQTPTSNLYTLFDNDGVLYAPFAWKANEMWVSAGGLDWTLVWVGDPGDKGIWHFVGKYAGYVHAVYARGFATVDAPQSYGHIRFRPGRVATLAGLRIEPPAQNLLLDLQSSSAESGLLGWDASVTTQLAWDPQRAFDGGFSVVLANTNSGADCSLRCPVVPHPLPAGMKVHGRIHMAGDESVLSIRLVDELHGQWGPRTLTSPESQWKTATCEFTPTYPDNAVRMVIEGWTTREGNKQTWLDAYQISVPEAGSTWIPGGSSRAGDVVRATVAFPLEWTDFICFKSDFSSQSAVPGLRTIKAWVQDNQNYAAVGFDGSAGRFSLVEVVDGVGTTLAESDPVRLGPDWSCRLGVRSSTTTTDVLIRVGAREVRMNGAPISVSPSELWIGSSPVGGDQAPGVYLLSRTFGSSLSEEDFQAELDFMPPLGDHDNDDDVDMDDFGAMTRCLAGPGINQTTQCPWFDTDFDSDVDLQDLARIEFATTAELP